MLHWLEHDLKVSNDALTKLKAAPDALHAMQPQPLLAVGKANVAALQKVLHMRNAQVRFESLVCKCRSGCCLNVFCQATTHYSRCRRRAFLH